jgi:hypothetical protein
MIGQGGLKPALSFFIFTCIALHIGDEGANESFPIICHISLGAVFRHCISRKEGNLCLCPLMSSIESCTFEICPFKKWIYGDEDHRHISDVCLSSLKDTGFTIRGI